MNAIYSADQALTPELSVALSLLAKGLEDVDEALAATQKGSDIFADDAIQRFQALLPELFTCRNLSDSFGAIINATLCSLENLRGLPMNQSQILILKQVLYRLRSEPFMRFESAVEEIMKLEEAGLIVEPLEFEALADWLDE